MTKKEDVLALLELTLGVMDNERDSVMNNVWGNRANHGG